MNRAAATQALRRFEAQDLVSERADLVIELIRALPRGCGVTVFADSLQAIYGFTTDDEGLVTDGDTRHAAERLRSNEAGEFKCKELGVTA